MQIEMHSVMWAYYAEQFTFDTITIATCESACWQCINTPVGNASTRLLAMHQHVNRFVILYLTYQVTAAHVWADMTAQSTSCGSTYHKRVGRKEHQHSDLCRHCSGCEPMHMGRIFAFDFEIGCATCKLLMRHRSITANSDI